MVPTLAAAESVEARAAAFAALGDPVRLRVIEELRHGERHVCQLQERLDVAAPLLSYHLRVLREAGLVEAERRGRWVDYRLSVTAMRSLCRAIRSAECAGMAESGER